MKSSRIGFIICRLFVALTYLYYLPTIACSLIYYFNSSDKYVTYLYTSLLYILVLVAFALVWVKAESISSWLGRGDGDTEIKVDTAQIGAIGLAIMGFFFLVRGFVDIGLLIRHMVESTNKELNPVIKLIPVPDFFQAIFSIIGGSLTFVFAPRLAIWLDNSLVDQQESINE